MKKTKLSVYEFLAMFPDQETARKYMEERRWPNGVTCPFCQTGKDKITVRKGGYYRCNPCAEDFTVRTGTIFGRSHVPLHKWLMAIYLVATSRKGISSLQLGKEIGVTQKTAWFLLHRIRTACANEIGMLSGVVQIDETYVGGLEKNKHPWKRTPDNGGRSLKTKTAVLGMREQGGRTKAQVIDSTGTPNLFKKVTENVEVGSTINTDEYMGYRTLKTVYKHETVNHKAKEYVRNGVTTNNIESVWALMKRGLHGVYHHASKKHLDKYVQEFAWRLNEGNVKNSRLERLASLVDAAVGKRLTYKKLIRGDNWEYRFNI